MYTYAVILAGGKGERLWPASAPDRPKPFLPLAPGGRTLLRATYDRVLPLVGKDRIYVVAHRQLRSWIQAKLGLPDERLVIEPEGRNTTPAIGLAAIVLQARDPEATMIVLPADHLVRDEEGFRKALTEAVRIAQEGYLVTLGIHPNRPATGYGYIQRGEPLQTGAFRVRRFVEKPDQATAERLLAEGGFYWNTGVFVWRVDRILVEIARFLPNLSAALNEARPHLGTPAWERVLAEAWSDVEAVSIDYGVMERVENVVVIPVDVGWSDVGDWHAVWEALPKDAAEVAAVGEHLGEGTARTLVWGVAGRPVVTLGVQGLVIIDMPEALLVAALDRTQDVRELVRRMRSEPPGPKRGQDPTGRCPSGAAV
ncbi:MAG: mannose-1-phosphate guanylyltransferase [Candidatus Bipolaricaulota bacterium]